MKITVFLFLACFLLLNNVFAGNTQKPAEHEDWTFMPAGAKPSYMGIHGGTMPVSLLISDDGASLLTFVGRTGNDFMEALRDVHIALPSFANATRLGLPGPGARTNLFAGNSTATMPVFAISGDALARLLPSHDLQPFGLSEVPLSIEGSVAKPESFPHARALRLFSMPDYFQPRRIRP